ncbi:MAG: tRNA pseudouridine(54/55) synthase Pus10 [Candidatus Bathyarchaeota archaeon]|nr:tRNA pseudouridine(54/55) synthase Pus10 [Candidatus Bathyarchaeota archaeon]MCX8176789.1 tRNA pseudouridine(54/55) synthase Pus10 [Candidatus Bathyarchaeota archaeon]MDW8193318.1 tRNA pseudouridine(54/55) synthase Pus10 [Nitrososphaerota archaeon]
MSILEKSLEMLKEYPLCDHCLGRQFAFLGTAMENEERGKAIKTILLMEAQAMTLSQNKKGLQLIKILATNGFLEKAEEVLKGIRKNMLKKSTLKTCFLCENRLDTIDELAKKAAEKIAEWECNTFLIGIELPAEVEEREDEFRAEFGVEHGESMRIEFGRLLGKKISILTGKSVSYSKPDVVLIINPMTEEIKVQVNPLYIAGRYRKLVRGIPQSKWFCSNCMGKGCEKCGWTGKKYPESVEEIISEPFITVTGGSKAYFHASGREDIDVRMLGKGRPFVLEISQPKKRFIDLKEVEKMVNAHAKGKVRIRDLKFVDKDYVRKLKKAELSKKYYRVVVEFESEVADDILRLIEEKLPNTIIKQRTPKRVLHRRADLTREKYIYKVKVKRLSSNKAELRLQCQGGLYVKELVTGDDGRTTPSITEIVGIKAKPISLDVLDVIIEQR